jgi:excisionase family DNA binding protein
MKRAKSTSPVEQWHQRLRPVAAKAVLREPNERRPTGRELERPRTVSEAAEELGLSVHTLRAWIACRRLAHLRLGRAIRIPAEEIRRVIEKSTVPAVEE